MSEASRTVRIVTSDETLMASAQKAVAALEGWDLAEPQSTEDLLANPPQRGDVILLDAWLRSENAYESCRRLTGRVHCRIFLVTDDRNEAAEGLASFCGATGILPRPLTAALLDEEIDREEAPRELPMEQRADAPPPRVLPNRILSDLAGEGSNRLIDAIIDPETGLLSYDYLSFKLDEEYKRARRFGQPLACVMLGFDGQAEEDVLANLASTILNASRDTDVLGRFDESSFLFFLPNTGVDGARIMAQRIREEAEAKGLRDLVGDALAISVGISFCPHPKVLKREDLFSRARAAYLSVKNEGGVVVAAE